MAYKKDTQPLAQQSAGCCFKNPRLPGMNALTAGEPATSRTRVSAGMLIDEAGCKGMRIGGAEVSHRHANFIVTHPGCTATNILELMEAVAEKVATSSGVTLEPEITIWRRTETKSAGL
jgi:UDP-N-acetylmuramate dehydrogenase